jgi:hypothetical protein
MIEDEIYVSTDRYIYYDDNGEIISISNSNDLTGNYIVLPLDRVINFLNAKENTNSYAIVYDTISKQHVLKLKYGVDETVFRVNDYFYAVERTAEQIPDLTVVQDIKNKQWIFLINEKLQSYLHSQLTSYSQKLQFSITRKNDPHDLYHLIIIDLTELIKNKEIKVPFKYQTEELIDDISVYTTKRFETYVYEVKND